MKYVRPDALPKTNPVKDEKFYSDWGRAHTSCQCCGRGDDLTTHHIVRQGRSHEPTNLLRLCQVCHILAEGLTVLDPFGRRIPRLTIGNCLWLKHDCEPEVYDEVRLQHLRGCRLPDREQPDPRSRTWTI